MKLIQLFENLEKSKAPKPSSVSSIQILNDEDFVFGTNPKDYDDGKIKYLSSKKVLYLVAKRGDINFICGINFRTGMVLFSSTKVENVEPLLRAPRQLFRPLNQLNAYKNFDICFNMLMRILKRYHMRIPSIVFAATIPAVNRLIERKFKIGMFKMLFKRYRYVVTEFAKEYDGVIMYQLEKAKK